MLFAWFAQTSFAQLQLSKPATQKTTVVMTHVSGKFVPVRIDSIKPFAPVPNAEFLINLKKSSCEHFKNFKATLVLNAERENNVNANVQWETKYAFYAKNFTIERSLADTFHFVPINFKAASATGSFKKKYQLPDYNDYNGISFYRIRQRNSDTAFVYSNIVSIKGYEATPLSIYPVPASDKIWINILSKQSGSLKINVFDAAGTMVLQQSVLYTANMHFIQGININKFSAGVYQVKILMPDKTFLNGKFIKD